MDIVWIKNKGPDFRISTFEQIARLRSEHRVLVGDVDELEVILPFPICNVCQVGISLLTVFANCQSVVEVILFEEFFGVLVRI